MRALALIGHPLDQMPEDPRAHVARLQVFFSEALRDVANDVIVAHPGSVGEAPVIQVLTNETQAVMAPLLAHIGVKETPMNLSLAALMSPFDRACNDNDVDPHAVLPYEAREKINRFTDGVSLAHKNAASMVAVAEKIIARLNESIVAVEAGTVTDIAAVEASFADLKLELGTLGEQTGLVASEGAPDLLAAALDKAVAMLLPTSIKTKLRQLDERIKFLAASGTQVQATMAGKNVIQPLVEDGDLYKVILRACLVQLISLNFPGTRVNASNNGFYSSIYLDKASGFRLTFGNLAPGERPLNHIHRSPEAKPDKPGLPGETTVLIDGGPFKYRSPRTGEDQVLVLDDQDLNTRLRTESHDSFDIYPAKQSAHSSFMYFSFKDADTNVEDRDYIHFMVERELITEIPEKTAEDFLIEAFGDNDFYADNLLLVKAMVERLGLDSVKKLIGEYFVNGEGQIILENGVFLELEIDKGDIEILVAEKRLTQASVAAKPVPALKGESGDDDDVS